MTALLAFLSLLIATPDLTKEEVKRLVAAGISDNVIVEYIRTNGPVQPLTPQDLIDLRQANVSEKVLSAMMQPATAPSPSQDYATGGTYYSYSSYPWYYPATYVYPYYYSYPYYRYPYYYRPYYAYPYHYSYPYRYAYPYSVHHYRTHSVPHMSAPAPQHPSHTYRGHR